ncbi:MAG: tetratricopeptide repeat protein [Anaerostipes sp.]|nr:tetratricopeptide repeat protein [Anaerostipes sp.]MDD3747490.1 tetratricopeptide repeat protein [Anaerostipes sp.]MDD4371271.1 tetratricopeptide repeat protein [Anaerostipes sp.]
MIKLTEEKMVKNNIKGRDLEKKGETDKAIKLYLKNIQNRFQGSHPYTRLATIYRKQKQYDKEIEVLELAVDVFTNDVPIIRPDREKKLENYKKQLEKARTR